MNQENLNRFIEAQRGDYENALQEIKNGRKVSHWMWYIFPQLDGLGFSAMSKKYSIKGLKQAEAYLMHPVLGSRLITISLELLELSGKTANQIFGSPDDLKLHSCMTLFSCVREANPVFDKVLSKYFNGKKDQQTLSLLEDGS